MAVVIDPLARGTVVFADASMDCRCTGRAPAYFGTLDDSDRTVVHHSVGIACNSDECTRTVMSEVAVVLVSPSWALHPPVSLLSLSSPRPLSPCV